MIRAVLPAIFIVLAIPSTAEQSGTVEVSLAGEVTTFTLSPEATQRRETSGFTTWHLSGEADDGATLTLIFGPATGAALPDSVKVEWRGSEASYAANADTGGALAVRDVEMSAETLTGFAFGGLVVPVEVIPGGALAPIEAAQGIEIDGRFDGSVSFE